MRMDKRRMRHIILDKIDSKPDLKYYIDNDYIYQVVVLIIDGICDVIDENNREIPNMVAEKLRLKGRRL